MPVLIHISPALGEGYGIVDDLGLCRLEKMLKKYPKLRIIGHSQPFWSEISGDNTESLRNRYPAGKVTQGRLHKLLRDYEHLYGDLSAGSGLNAMTRDEDHALRFLEEFQDKLMFATDICSAQNTHHLAISRFYDRLHEGKLISEQIYRKICRDNAIRILKLAS
jgi:predicted TIM-barrel fold metal-dependent hydrolase